MSSYHHSQYYRPGVSQGERLQLLRDMIRGAEVDKPINTTRGLDIPFCFKGKAYLARFKTCRDTFKQTLSIDSVYTASAGFGEIDQNHIPILRRELRRKVTSR